MEERSRIETLAAEMLRLGRNTLLVNLRFLDAALHQLTPRAEESISTLATDGAALFYSPLYVLRSWKTAREIPVRDYLHVILHCVFRHMYVHTLVDHRCWDLACDIAVENSITELGLPSAAAPRQEEQQETIAELKTAVNRLTAETLYRHFMDAALPGEELAQLRALFRGDNHALWYAVGEKPSEPGESPSDPAGEARWEEISWRMLLDMETFSRQRGEAAAELMQNLREVNRERYDYAAFLR